MISIIVPCYNEQESLPIFYKEVSNVIGGMKQDYELIFIDDGSEDDTVTIMKQMAVADDHIIYLSFSKNFGKEAAMYAGFCNANGVMWLLWMRICRIHRSAFLR